MPEWAFDDTPVRPLLPLSPQFAILASGTEGLSSIGRGTVSVEGEGW